MLSSSELTPPLCLMCLFAGRSWNRCFKAVTLFLYRCTTHSDSRGKGISLLP